MATSALFSPYTLRDVTFRNRLWVAAMCEYSVDQEDGVPVDWHLVHLGAFARGGAGLIITEATGVNAAGRISPQDTGIYNDEQRDAWARIVSFIHDQGSLAAMQLAHAGRKASTYRPWSEKRGTVPPEEGGWQPDAPSAIAFAGYSVPTELTVSGIAQIVVDFTTSARRAIDAGFDVIEVHAAHGYLIHQFLSPLSNLRTDAYGGSLENRAKLLLEIVAAIRVEVGEKVPILIRFSATDWAEGGWDQEQTARVAEWSQVAGADFFDISTGGLVAGTTIPLGPGYQVPFADYVKHESAVEVGTVGLITEAAQAEQIIASGQADVVMMAREMMRDPHFPLRAAHELGVELDYWPRQYLRAKWRS